MKVYEYGTENKRTLLMFQSSAEPYWVFVAAAQAMAKDFHVFLAAAEGHNPEEDSTFISVEKYADDAAAYLKAHGVTELDALYGISMGGATAMRFLASQALPVKKAILFCGLPMTCHSTGKVFSIVPSDITHRAAFSLQHPHKSL